MRYQIELNGQDLIQYRTAQGMTRSELALKLGISYPYLANIESENVLMRSTTEAHIREICGLTDYRLAKLRQAFSDLQNI